MYSSQGRNVVSGQEPPAAATMGDGGRGMVVAESCFSHDGGGSGGAGTCSVVAVLGIRPLGIRHKASRYLLWSKSVML